MATLPSEVIGRIEALVKNNPIMLFMKGNDVVPQCGFSANCVGILKQLGANYKTYDILKDPELRQAIKDYANWPTFPQLYANGTLIGGNDIVMELFQRGELAEALK
jgi:monothiol glutaredoxin